MPIPKISVIIPVYNVEPYICECLDSVVNQTLRDIEIICVNDGSTDNSGVVLTEYAARDERITVITQKNRGLSAARNIGMDAARGKYIYFIDSDDYIDLDALKILYKRAEELKLDVLCFDFANFHDGAENGLEHFGRREYGGMRRGVSLLKDMRDDNAYAIGVWTMLFRLEFLLDIDLHFREGAIYEDIVFTSVALLEAKRTSHLKRELYYYRLRSNSITRVPLSAKNIHGCVMALQDALLYGLSKDLDERQAYELWRTVEYCWRWAKCFAEKVGKEEAARTIFDKPISHHIYQHLILNCIAAEDELSSLRKELTKVQNELNQQCEETVKLNTEAVRLHNKNSDLLATINNLNFALLAANGKTTAAEQSVTAAWQEVENIHRSATYRIGRVITWVPRMARGFARCYREHGWRYTWHRVVTHLRGR